AFEPGTHYEVRMTENPLDLEAPPAPNGPDPDWPARTVRRIRQAMEALVDTSGTAMPAPVCQGGLSS
ncbi:MAG: hypothetical protein ACXVH5_04720, partial [Ilumatobacteraceae bacterium]